MTARVCERVVVATPHPVLVGHTPVAPVFDRRDLAHDRAALRVEESIYINARGA
ncbi:hypothetical protein [Haloarchaeobius baliensis]|uniref:hypothetical protein n=1 Tax=Haloarchaeobius baliensis TaxID=1670458 RepID=UPI003F88285B